MQALRWFVLAASTLVLPSLALGQAALTCEVTATPGGVCVDGTITDSRARVVTVTVVREALCVEQRPPGVSQRREARARSTQSVQVAGGAATFHTCVSGTLTPPCADDATVNEDGITVTTSPDNLGCTLPGP